MIVSNYNLLKAFFINTSIGQTSMGNTPPWYTETLAKTIDNVNVNVINKVFNYSANQTIYTNCAFSIERSMLSYARLNQIDDIQFTEDVITPAYTDITLSNLISNIAKQSITNNAIMEDGILKNTVIATYINNNDTAITINGYGLIHNVQWSQSLSDAHNLGGGTRTQNVLIYENNLVETLTVPAHTGFTVTITWSDTNIEK